MYKFLTLLALVACAFAAPAPAPGYVGPAAYHSAAVVAAPVSYHSVPVTSYHQAPVAVASAYHPAPVLAYQTASVVAAPAATSHQQLTKIDKSSTIVSHHPVTYAQLHAPAYAYIH